MSFLSPWIVVLFETMGLSLSSVASSLTLESPAQQEPRRKTIQRTMQASWLLLLVAIMTHAAAAHGFVESSMSMSYQRDEEANLSTSSDHGSFKRRRIKCDECQCFSRRSRSPAGAKLRRQFESHERHESLARRHQFWLCSPPEAGLCDLTQFHSYVRIAHGIHVK